jgi:hypothetical protein
MLRELGNLNAALFPFLVLEVGKRFRLLFGFKEFAPSPASFPKTHHELEIRVTWVTVWPCPYFASSSQ